MLWDVIVACRFALLPGCCGQNLNALSSLPSGAETQCQKMSWKNKKISLAPKILNDKIVYYFVILSVKRKIIVFPTRQSAQVRPYLLLFLIVTNFNAQGKCKYFLYIGFQEKGICHEFFEDIWGISLTSLSNFLYVISFQKRLVAGGLHRGGTKRSLFQSCECEKSAGGMSILPVSPIDQTTSQKRLFQLERWNAPAGSSMLSEHSEF